MQIQYLNYAQLDSSDLDETVQRRLHRCNPESKGVVKAPAVVAPYWIRSDVPNPTAALEMVAEITRAWRDSTCCRTLQALLLSKTAHVPRISKIVCFNADEVKPIEKDVHGYSLLLRYHVIASMAVALGVKVFAQDPYYDPWDMKFLRQQCEIKVTHDPDGYLMIDEDTLVIDCASDYYCNQPVLEVIADSTHPSHRPAAIICPKIEFNEEVGVLGSDSRATPRVFEMLKEYVADDFSSLEVDTDLLALTEDKKLKHQAEAVFLRQSRKEEILWAKLKSDRRFWLWDMQLYTRRTSES